MPLINPSRGHRFLAGSAFPRPPRLTLDPVRTSEVKPPRLMLGGGAERGWRGGRRRRCDPCGPKPPTRVKLQSFVSGFRGFLPTGLRQSRDRGFYCTPAVGLGHAAYRKPNGAAGGRRARDLCVRTCTQDGGGGTVEFDKKPTEATPAAACGASYVWAHKLST